MPVSTGRATDRFSLYRRERRRPGYRSHHTRHALRGGGRQAHGQHSREERFIMKHALRVAAVLACASIVGVLVDSNRPAYSADPCIQFQNPNTRFTCYPSAEGQPCTTDTGVTQTLPPTLNECNPSAHNCPVGTECNCCCGTWVCMPPYLPCCALPCLLPTPPATPTPTPIITCQPIAGLTDCEEDSDCVVVDQIDCCPCQTGGVQAAINASKQDELSQQLEVCCAAAGVCFDVYQCEDNLAAVCHSGTCTLVNTAGTPTPTPTPTRTALRCVGDCSGDGVVTVDEIVRMVNIALNGDTSASSCPGSDQWCSSGPVLGAVRIACLIDAVNNLLTGCPTPG
jgi:hypothetical protein